MTIYSLSPPLFFVFLLFPVEYIIRDISDKSVHTVPCIPSADGRWSHSGCASVPWHAAGFRSRPFQFPPQPPRRCASQSRAIGLAGHLNIPVQDIGVLLHEERILAGDSSTGIDIRDLHSVFMAVFQDNPGSTGDTLQHAAVDLLRLCFQGQALNNSGQLLIAQNTPVSIPPVQYSQGIMLRSTGSRLFTEQGVDGTVLFLRLLAGTPRAPGFSQTSSACRLWRSGPPHSRKSQE